MESILPTTIVNSAAGILRSSRTAPPNGVTPWEINQVLSIITALKVPTVVQTFVSDVLVMGHGPNKALKRVFQNNLKKNRTSID